MIASKGYEAVFKHKREAKERKPWFRMLYLKQKTIELRDDEDVDALEIVAWSEDGDPLVVGTRGLVPAASFSNFVGIRSRDDESIKQIMSADGWLSWARDQDGTWHPQRILCFALKGDGSVTPMDVDGSYIDDIRITGQEWRISHESEGPPIDTPESAA